MTLISRVVRPLRRIGLAAAVVALAACAQTEANQAPGPGFDRPATQVRMHDHTVRFPPLGAEPGASERAAFRRFLEDAGAGRHDAVSITASGPADPALVERRADWIAGEIRRRNPDASVAMSRERVAMASSGRGGRDALDVHILRHHAVLPDCPDWSRSRIGGYYNLPSSNFGCATQTNLGVMIDDPRDLARGRPLGPADGARAAQGVERYREPGDADDAAPVSPTGGGL